MMMKIEEYCEHFEGSGDIEYLKLHYHRFCKTKELAYQQWKWERADILDIGAHWLHLSVLFALDGHHVTAADFSNPLDEAGVQKIAEKHDIELLVYEDLDSEGVFDQLETDSMDVILFCEIIEHITFNPLAMWKAIHRVLKPGGRIIVTTPNFYSVYSMRHSIFRFMSGWGSGIAVTDILNKRTNTPHWKEFSRKELCQYFTWLSADFSVRDEQYFAWFDQNFQLNWKGILAHDKKNIFPFFRKGLYLAIELVDKNNGINIKPGC